MPLVSREAQPGQLRGALALAGAMLDHHHHTTLIIGEIGWLIHLLLRFLNE